jgi:glycine dehydrogenase subunit 2
MTKIKNIQTIFEKGNNCPLNHNRISGVAITDDKIEDIIPETYLEEKHGYSCDEVLILPEVSEIEIVRHYIGLSRLNYGVDNGFYPLGSCTMKYNPKINENIASLDGFLNIHPLQSECQGSLELLYDLEQKLNEITGMDAFSLQPAAGAHGEFVGISIIKKYLEVRGDLKTKTKILIPDSAHGTNPATSAMCGFSVIVINSNDQGEIRLDELEFALKQGDVAGIMLTNPNTLGLFERDVLKITEMIHK